MPKRIIVALLALALVTGCARISGSRLNPFNWFGASRPDERAVLVDETGAVQDLRPLMDQVTGLTVEPTPGGAIVTATGLPPTQGFYAGDLVPAPGAAPGVLSYAFRVRPPLGVTRISTPQSREIVVGLRLTQQALAGVREIRVTAARNARSARR